MTGYEFEEFVKRIKPDLIGSGIKEKYIFQKMGIPFRQMHSWDYSGPYHGYDGFAIFARDMDMTMNNPCWDAVTPPWKRKHHLHTDRITSPTSGVLPAGHLPARETRP